MPCDTRRKPNQTIQQRATEVRDVIKKVTDALIAGRVKAKVGPRGEIAFDGLAEKDRDGVTDNCMYRRILSAGSTLAMAKLQQAEALAGRKVDRAVVNSGAHSHDGGRSWHDHKG